MHHHHYNHSEYTGVNRQKLTFHETYVRVEEPPIWQHPLKPSAICLESNGSKPLYMLLPVSLYP
jgi:hypothetical protein